MEKYLVDFIDPNGEFNNGIVRAENIDEAATKAHQIVEAKNGIVTNVMLWSDAVLATMDPDDYAGKGDNHG